MSDHKKGGDQHNNSFEHYLTGKSRLSDTYKKSESSGLPSTKLDAQILAVSRHAVANDTRSIVKKKQLFFSANFYVPFATAASVLIVVSVVNLLPNQSVYDSTIIRSDEIVSLESAQTPDATLANSLDARYKQSFSAEKPQQKSLLANPSNVLQNELAPLAESLIPADHYRRQSEITSNKDNIGSIGSMSTLADKNMNNSEHRLSKQVEQSQKPQSSAVTKMELNSIQLQSGDSLTQATTESEIKTESFSTLKKSKNKLKYGVSLRPDNLIYVPEKWQFLSSDEWLRRIKLIHQNHDTQKAIKILHDFNKKFPELKIDPVDFIKNIEK